MRSTYKIYHIKRWIKVLCNKFNGIEMIDALAVFIAYVTAPEKEFGSVEKQNTNFPCSHCFLKSI
jgi:hypothetical protein